MTIHDISFVAHPEWFRAGEGLRRRWLTRRGAATAAVIFTDSAVLALGARTPPPRRSVADSGDSARRRRARRPADAPGSRREPLVLFVGSLFNRRRLPDLIAAFAQRDARHPDRPAGHRRRRPHVAAPGSSGNRRCSRGVETADRVPQLHRRTRSSPTLYARASVFVFLSEYEGFGLTPLEAMAAGVPAVVLDTPVAREVYGDAAIFVARGDIAGLRQRDSPAAAGSRRARRRCSSRAPAVLARYSWDAAAAQHARAPREDRAPMTLSIVIVSYNARADLERCLASLHARPRRRCRTTSSSSTTRRPTAALDAVRSRWPAVQRDRARPHNCGFAAGKQRRHPGDQRAS